MRVEDHDASDEKQNQKQEGFSDGHRLPISFPAAPLTM
jgi:hypothetical protein